MATTLLLLAMVAFMVWAIVHTERRIGWHQDELDAEAFLAALRQEPFSVTLNLQLNTQAFDVAIGRARRAAERAAARAAAVTGQR